MKQMWTWRRIQHIQYKTLRCFIIMIWFLKTATPNLNNDFIEWQLYYNFCWHTYAYLTSYRIIIRLCDSCIFAMHDCFRQNMSYWIYGILHVKAHATINYLIIKFTANTVVATVVTNQVNVQLCWWSAKMNILMH